MELDTLFEPRDVTLSYGEWGQVLDALISRRDDALKRAQRKNMSSSTRATLTRFAKGLDDIAESIREQRR